jgi:hypothetical protein
MGGIKMEIDFTDQIKQLKKAMAEKNYPGKNVKRRKDGVPQKKQKKRACKKGEHRDKSGKLVKNSKADKEAGYNPETEPISPDHLESNPNFNKENIEVQEAELPLQPTKGLENPRNMHEYYKNLYRKVKGMD